MRWYRSLSGSNSSLPIPQPSAVTIVPTSAEPSILSKRAFSTFKIFPLRGKIAWNFRFLLVLQNHPQSLPPPSRAHTMMGLAPDNLPTFRASQQCPAPLCGVSSHALFSPLLEHVRVEHLANNQLRIIRVFQKELNESSAHGLLNNWLHFLKRAYPWSAMKT